MRLVKSAKLGITVRASWWSYLHEFDAASVEIDDLRVLDEPVDNAIEQADLCEQPQCLRVVGDRSRQSDQPVIFLEDDDIYAGGAKQVGEH